MRVIISGGGTGGHIFPAISIANALREADPSVEILFVGALGKMEMEKVPQAGYEIVGLPVAGFHRKLSLRNVARNFVFPFKLLRSLYKASSVVRLFNPDVAVGVGGYASGPVLYLAARRGVRCVVQEQNSFPGVTNRILASRVDKVCVAYPNMERFFPKEKIILTGNPVRQSLVSSATRDEAAREFGLAPSRKVVLVIGGSLGARSINNGVRRSLGALSGGVQLLWQTGAFYYDEIAADLERNPVEGVKALPFIRRMDLAYALADIVVSRAGASSISELALLGKPTILVPSPNVSEDHQTKNARALEDEGAAIMVADSKADTLISVAVGALADPQKIAALGENIATFARPAAASDIAREVFSLTKS